MFQVHKTNDFLFTCINPAAVGRSTDYDVRKLNIVCVCVMFRYSVKSQPLFLMVDKDVISNAINMGWIHSLHSQNAIDSFGSPRNLVH